MTLIGDGHQEVVVVAGERLKSWEELQKIGSNFRLKKTIKESEKVLLQKLWDLEENGK